MKPARFPCHATVTRRILPTAAAALTLLLAACGGGSDAGADPGGGSTPAQAFTASVQRLEASETAEPMALDGIDNAASETEEPIPLGA